MIGSAWLQTSRTASRTSPNAGRGELSDLRPSRSPVPGRMVSAGDPATGGTREPVPADRLPDVLLVGLGRFELPASSPPVKRANQAAPQPVAGTPYLRSGAAPNSAPSGSDEPFDELEQAPAEIDHEGDHHDPEVPGGAGLLRHLLVRRVADEASASNAGAIRGDVVRVVEPVARLTPGHAQQSPVRGGQGKLGSPEGCGPGRSIDSPRGGP